MGQLGFSYSPCFLEKNRTQRHRHVHIFICLSFSVFGHHRGQVSSHFFAFTCMHIFYNRPSWFLASAFDISQRPGIQNSYVDIVKWLIKKIKKIKKLSNFWILLLFLWFIRSFTASAWNSNSYFLYFKKDIALHKDYSQIMNMAKKKKKGENVFTWIHVKQEWHLDAIK